MKHLLASLRAAQANVIPALILQAVAVAIALAYYFWPPANQVLEQLGQIKRHGGYAFSSVSTALWAGLIPLLLQRWQTGSRREPLSRYPFFIIYWGLLGILYDAFYRLQAWIFGDNARFLTVAAKDALDSFVFSPFMALPLAVAAYAWKDGDFRTAALRAIFQPGWYAERVFPVLVSAWLVWIPTLAAIYALPLSLQVPIMNLVECLWVLFLMVLTAQESGTSNDDGQP